ncbi:MAG: hypothetical protein WC050_02115 [Candidatus Paceibacterota bacterium]
MKAPKTAAQQLKIAIPTPVVLEPASAELPVNVKVVLHLAGKAIEVPDDCMSWVDVK